MLTYFQDILVVLSPTVTWAAEVWSFGICVSRVLRQRSCVGAGKVV